MIFYIVVTSWGGQLFRNCGEMRILGRTLTSCMGWTLECVFACVFSASVSGFLISSNLDADDRQCLTARSATGEAPSHVTGFSAEKCPHFWSPGSRLFLSLLPFEMLLGA